MPKGTSGRHSDPRGDANQPKGKPHRGDHREPEYKPQERKVVKSDPKDHPHGAGVN